MLYKMFALVALQASLCQAGQEIATAIETKLRGME